MSTLKVDGIRSNSATSDAITLASDGTCTANITNNLSNRRLTINGAMQVAQRGQVTGVTNGFGGPDRYRFHSNHNAVTMSQSTDVPTGEGFVKSLKLDVTTAGGDSNADTFTEINYKFEGQDLQSLCYGTSSAKTITLSFWIKSPKAGIHWVRLYGDELSDGNNAFICRKYTVSTANTWQKVTLSFPGYTSDGFNNDNTTGMRISWYFAQGSAYSSGTAQADDGGWLDWSSASDRARNTVGQVNCFDSTSNDIYLTGVQLEVGSVATDFEHRSYAQELELCRRYFQVLVDDGSPKSFGNGTCYSATNMHLIVQLNPEMRTTPTLDYTTGSNYYDMYRDNSADQFDSFSLEGTSHKRAVDLFATGGASGSQGASALLRTNNSNAKIRFTAEL
jgi:hypothetical protein